MDQHDDGAGARYAKLEARLEILLCRLDEMTQEVAVIKQQQSDILEYVKITAKKK